MKKKAKKGKDADLEEQQDEGLVDESEPVEKPPPLIGPYAASLPTSAELAVIAANFISPADIRIMDIPVRTAEDEDSIPDGAEHEGRRRISAAIKATPHSQVTFNPASERAITEAIQKAAQLYLRCAGFTSAYQKASTVEDRAMLCGDGPAWQGAQEERFATELSDARRKDKIPMQPHEFEGKVPPYPTEEDGSLKQRATLDDFLSQVVKFRDNTESTARFRDFLQDLARETMAREGGPRENLHKETHTLKCEAGLQIGRMKSEGLNVAEWIDLGMHYLAWHRNKVSEQNRQTRLKAIEAQAPKKGRKAKKRL